MNSISGLHVKGICPKIQGTKESRQKKIESDELQPKSNAKTWTAWSSIWCFKHGDHQEGAAFLDYLMHVEEGCPSSNSDLMWSSQIELPLPLVHFSLYTIMYIVYLVSSVLWFYFIYFLMEIMTSHRRKKSRAGWPDLQRDHYSKQLRGVCSLLYQGV